MGQYRQWLHYRELDHQLHARLTRIEQQTTELEAEIRYLADYSDTNTNDNVIIRALIGMYTAPPQEQVLQETAPIELAPIGVPMEDEQHNGSATEMPSWAASTLFAQSYLTSFDAFDSATAKALSPYAETGLLPEDLAVFFAGLAPNGTNGQSYDATDALTSSHSATPIDKQSQRNDRLIQRWFERWGQSSEDQESQQEGQGL